MKKCFWKPLALVHKLEHSLTATTFYKKNLFTFIPVSFRSIPVHSGPFRCHSGQFRSIPVSFRFIPVHSGVIPVHSGPFRSIPVHSTYSGSFRSVSVFSNAPSDRQTLLLTARRDNTWETFRDTNTTGTDKAGFPGGTPYNALYEEAPLERGTFFTLQVYKRVGISQVEVYKRVGKSVI